MLLGQPPVLQLGLGIRMAVQLLRVPLTPASCADTLPFPMPLVQPGISLGMPSRVVVEHLFLLPNDDSIHDRLHARYAARDCRRSLRFVRRLDPSRELDGAFADGADVDPALAEDGIVAKGFEHPLLELGVETLVRGEPARDADMIQVIAAQPSDLVAEPRREAGNPADLLRHDHADDEARRGTDPDLRESAAERFALVTIAKWSHAVPVAEVVSEG